MENSSKTDQKAIVEQLLQQKHELLAKIEQECMENESFREKLLKDPTLAIRTIFMELGSVLPERIRIMAHEEDDNTMHIVVPPKANRELSMKELDDVSGGSPCLNFSDLGGYYPVIHNSTQIEIRPDLREILKKIIM